MTRAEVTAVAIILAVLGVVLVPFLCESHRMAIKRANKEQPVCTYNLKQLGNAATLYEGDNQGVRPGPQPMGVDIQGISWDRPLAFQEGVKLSPAGIYEPLDNLTSNLPSAAVKTLAIFTCPVDPVDAQAKGGRLVPLAPGSLADGMASGKGICRSYVLNLGTGNPVDGIAPAADAVPFNKISSSAGTVYLIESHGYATVFGQRNIANDTTMTCSKTGDMMPPDAFTNPQVPMHGMPGESRVNVLMHDGHVEALEQGAITANGGQIMQYVKEAKLQEVGK